MVAANQVSGGSLRLRVRRIARRKSLRITIRALLVNFWAINRRVFTPADSTIRFSQRRRPTIAAGDDVVLFERERDGVVFDATGTVKEAASTSVAENQLAFTAVVTPISRLDPPRLLLDFTYSLIKVYRYNRPARHFTGKYVSLTSADYKAIDAAHIFWARTAFGTYLNALPGAAVTQFIQSVAETDPDLLVGRSSYGALWVYLYTFIKERYLGAHQLTAAIAEMAERLEVEGHTFAYDQIRLGEDDVEVTDGIQEQGRRLAAFAASLERSTDDERDIFAAMNSRITANDQTETTFEAQFRGTRWPTQMIRL
jgi:hypothetical protein